MQWKFKLARSGVLWDRFGKQQHVNWKKERLSSLCWISPLQQMEFMLGSVFTFARQVSWQNPLLYLRKKMSISFLLPINDLRLIILYYNLFLIYRCSRHNCPFTCEQRVRNRLRRTIWEYEWVYEWIYVKVVCNIKPDFTQTEGFNKSERCLQEGRLASHEITKQTEAYRLPSSNILSGC